MDILHEEVSRMKMKVLFWTLVHLGVVLSGQVNIEYNKPVLKLTLPSVGLYTTSDVSRVILRYTVQDVPKHGVAVLITEGWQYQTCDVSLDGADEVSVYAVIYDLHGNLKDVTGTSTLKLAHSRAVQIPSPRRIRAVIFRDDFISLNKDNWRFEVSMYGGSHGQFQVHTSDHKTVYTHDGHLYIKPMPTVNDPRFNDNFLHTGHMDLYALFGQCTNDKNNGCSRTGGTEILPPVMSSKIYSVPSIRFGTVEVRARLPKGDWMWPAIWMVPKDSVYGGWPMSGEIDIMESKGNSGANFSERITSHLIWGTSWQHQNLRYYQGIRHGTNWQTQFHTWRMEWTHEHILMFVDNQQILTAVPPPGGLFEQGKFTGTNLWSSGSKMAPFDQDFVLILSLAIGGTDGYFPDGNHYGNVTKPWHNNYSPHPMLDFWNAKNSWLPTWHGENAALVVDYVEFKTQVIDTLAQVIDTLAQVIDTLAQVIDTLAQVIDTLAQVIDTLAQVIDTLAQVIDTLAQVIDTLVQVIDTLAQVIDTLVQVIDTLVQVIDTLAQVIDTLVQVIDTLVQVIDTLAQVIDTLAQVIDTLAQVIDTLAQVIDTLAQVIDTLAQVIDTLAQVIDTLAQVIDTLAQVIDAQQHQQIITLLRRWNKWLVGGAQGYSNTFQFKLTCRQRKLKITLIDELKDILICLFFSGFLNIVCLIWI
ncbi:beta-1 3-glucan-binding protein [Biomphalaria glabrata]